MDSSNGPNPSILPSGVSDSVSSRPAGQNSDLAHSESSKYQKLGRAVDPCMERSELAVPIITTPTSLLALTPVRLNPDNLRCDEAFLYVLSSCKA